MIKNILFPILFLGILIVSYSCEKFTKSEVVTGNSIPYYDGVPTIKVKAYLSRLYIDLIGRNPSDSELTADLSALKSAGLSAAAREAICLRLQTDTAFHEGELSYHRAYCHWFFERFKSDLMSNADSIDYVSELDGEKDTVVIRKVNRIWHAEQPFAEGKYTFNEVISFMIDNKIYDKLNMQAENYVRATFYDLFGRYPTSAENQIAVGIIGKNTSGILFETAISNKDEYIAAIVKSREFYNGMVERAYYKLMHTSSPSTALVARAMQQLYKDNDYTKMERSILISDEYAQFEPVYR